MKSANLVPCKRIEVSALGIVVAVSFMCFSLLLFPALSPAATLSGDSRTYFQYREAPDSSKILGGYEYLDLAIGSLGNENISFHTGGWLRYNLKGEESGKKTNNDLQYSYLSYRGSTDNLVVNLGRVMVFEGVAAERVDGIYARTDLMKGFAISGFGGAPVETEIDETGTIYGGRLTHQMPGLYRIGASYLKEDKDSSDFREETGIDLWTHPMNKVDLVGRSNYNVLTGNWMEHTYNLVLGPFEKILLTTEASRINYEDYFTGATSAAFILTPAIVNPKEKLTRFGEVVTLALTDRLNAVVDYRTYDYEVAGDAKSFGGGLTYSVLNAGGAGISLRRMDGKIQRLSYNEYRGYVFKKIGKIDAAIDVLNVKYDTEINGTNQGFSATAAAQYELSHNLKIGADVEYQKNPDFDKDVRLFAKVIYGFDYNPGTSPKAAASHTHHQQSAPETPAPVEKPVKETEKAAAGVPAAETKPAEAVSAPVSAPTPEAKPAEAVSVPASAPGAEAKPAEAVSAPSNTDQAAGAQSAPKEVKQ